MKTLFSIILLFLGLNLFSVEIVVYKDTDCVDFLELLEENDVMFYQISAVDADESNNLYFLAHKLCTILRIDGKSGKLINTIGSKGQGPAELDIARTIRVINGKVFVPDSGFGGVKIFSVNGSLIKEFRTHHTISWLDVNQKEDIYVKESESDATPIIALYNNDGKRLSTIVRFPFKGMPDRLEMSNQSHFTFRVDSEGNVIVLNDRARTLLKYNSNGRLLWNKRIENEILDKYLHLEKKPHFDKLGNIRSTTIVRKYMDIDKNDNIVIGHAGGGMVVDKNGNTFKLIKFESLLKHLQIFKVFGNDSKLINLIVLGDYIDVIDYTKIKKGGNNDF